MATYQINKRTDIADMLAADPSVVLQDEDVLVHKPFQFYDIAAMVTESYPNAKIFPCTIGTDLYTQHGYNTSLVIVAGSPAG